MTKMMVMMNDDTTIWWISHKRFAVVWSILCAQANITGTSNACPKYGSSFPAKTGLFRNEVIWKWAGPRSKTCPPFLAIQMKRNLVVELLIPGRWLLNDRYWDSWHRSGYLAHCLYNCKHCKNRKGLARADDCVRAKNCGRCRWRRCVGMRWLPWKGPGAEGVGGEPSHHSRCHWAGKVPRNTIRNGKRML